MGKPNLPNQKKAYRALNSRLQQYVARVQGIYDMLNSQAANMVVATGYDGSVPFLFRNYPELARLVDGLKNDYVGSMRGLIYTGTSDEWKQSNLLQDLLVKKVLKYYDAQVDGEKHRVYYDPNSDALKAFQNRREHGMNLSAKLWNQSENYVRGLECAISSAIEKGTSAVTLSKRLSQYLNDFPSLKADYAERFGKAVDCADCEYRSIRLARSEINMAYRRAEQTRWKRLDFIIGYDIKTSGSHPKEDICDMLQGRYPKDFDYEGWHPNCMCYCIPVVMSEDDYWRMREGRTPSVQPVTDLPENFKEYVRNNERRIAETGKRGTQPYWIKNNIDLVDKALAPSEWMITREQATELKQEGFNAINPDRYNDSVMQGFQLPRFNQGMDAIGDSADIYWKSKAVNIFANGNASMTYKGQTEYGPVEMVRNFMKTDRGVEVTLERMKLPDELQGKGITKAIFRELFREYGDMRIARANIKANMNEGGLAWAKYGFTAKRSEVLNLLERSVGSRITREEYDEAVDLVESYRSDVFPMNLLARLPYSEKLLRGNHWQGFLDFGNTPQVDFMKEYVGYPE